LTLRDNCNTMSYVMKEDMITIRVSKQEKKDIEQLTKKEGHSTVSGFIMWLIRQYEKGNLRQRR